MEMFEHPHLDKDLQNILTLQGVNALGEAIPNTHLLTEQQLDELLLPENLANLIMYAARKYDNIPVTHQTRIQEKFKTVLQEMNHIEKNYTQWVHQNPTRFDTGWQTYHYLANYLQRVTEIEKYNQTIPEVPLPTGVLLTALEKKVYRILRSLPSEEERSNSRRIYLQIVYNCVSTPQLHQFAFDTEQGFFASRPNTVRRHKKEDSFLTGIQKYIDLYDPLWNTMPFTWVEEIVIKPAEENKTLPRI